jgi:hypothetical protein
MMQCIAEDSKCLKALEERWDDIHPSIFGTPLMALLLYLETSQFLTDLVKRNEGRSQIYSYCYGIVSLLKTRLFERKGSEYFEIGWYRMVELDSGVRREARNLDCSVNDWRLKWGGVYYSLLIDIHKNRALELFSDEADFIPFSNIVDVYVLTNYFDNEKRPISERWFF